MKKKVLLICPDVDMALQLQREIIKMASDSDIIIVRDSNDFKKHKSDNVANIIQCYKNSIVSEIFESISPQMTRFKAERVLQSRSIPNYKPYKPYISQRDYKPHYRGNHRY